MEVVLRQRIAVAADLQDVVDVGGDRHLDHVPGVLDGELGGLTAQQRSATIGGHLVGPDVHGRLAHALAAGREPDVGPNAGARSARSGRGSTPQRAPPERYQTPASTLVWGRPRPRRARLPQRPS
jgi:hypothetical protein